jgi:radical SAM superfamily enzyme YgiQ (UPF0313 family)
MEKHTQNLNGSKQTNGSAINNTNSKRKDSQKVLLVTASTGLGFNYAPHFGMYQILNYLKFKDMECDMYDRDLELFKKAEIYENDVMESLEKGKYDIVGISVSQDRVLGEQKMIADLELIWRMRSAAEKSGKIPVFVAGGQAAQLNYKQWLDLGIDLIVNGYGEKVFYDVCKRYFSIPKESRNATELINLVDKMTHEVRGVSYKDKKNIYRYIPAPTVDEKLFKELFFEFPQKYEMPHHTFWDILRENNANKDLGASNFVVENVRLYTTSHCPRRCGFCNSGQFLPEASAAENDLMIDKTGMRFSSGKQKLVQLNAKELMDLVMFNVKKYGAKSVLFSDDDFALKSKHNRVMEFCKLIMEYKKKGLMAKDFQFNCQTHVSDWLTNHKEVNKELIETVAKAGFGSISVGVETFTDRVIVSPSINKAGYKSEHAQAVLNCMLENGIVPQVNVILGVPEYTVEDLLITIDIALDFIIKGCDLSLSRQLLALPGAPVYESGMYKVVYDKWTHPSGKEVKIPDYFVPNDPKIAYAMEHFDVEARKSLDKVIKKMKWGNKNPPKRVIAVSAVACLPKLLGRDDLSPKYYKILDDVLAGKLRGTKEVSYALDIQGIDQEFDKKKVDGIKKAQEEKFSDVIIDTRV